MGEPETGEEERLIMSTEDDERRLYQCARKYEKIVKQFDELIEMMNSRTRPPKRRKVCPSSRGSSNIAASAPASSCQPDNNEAFVESITKFLHELRANPTTDADHSTSTKNPE